MRTSKVARAPCCCLSMTKTWTANSQTKLHPSLLQTLLPKDFVDLDDWATSSAHPDHFDPLPACFNNYKPHQSKKDNSPVIDNIRPPCPLHRDDWNCAQELTVVEADFKCHPTLRSSRKPVRDSLPAIEVDPNRLLELPIAERAHMTCLPYHTINNSNTKVHMRTSCLRHEA